MRWDPKGKKRATGENQLEDIQAQHHKRQQLMGKEPEVVRPSVSLRGPSVEIGEPSGSKPKKKFGGRFGRRGIGEGTGVGGK